MVFWQILSMSPITELYLGPKHTILFGLNTSLSASDKTVKYSENKNCTIAYSPRKMKSSPPINLHINVHVHYEEG